MGIYILRLKSRNIFAFSVCTYRATTSSPHEAPHESGGVLLNGGLRGRSQKAACFTSRNEILSTNVGFYGSVRFQHRRLAFQLDHMRHAFDWWGSCNKLCNKCDLHKSMFPSWENMMLNVCHRRKAVVAASSLNMYTWSDLFNGFGQCPWEQAAQCCKNSQVSVTEDPCTPVGLVPGHSWPVAWSWLQWVQLKTVFYTVQTGAAPLFALRAFRNGFEIKEEVSVCKLELVYFECGLCRHPCPWTECQWIVRQPGMDLIGPECSLRPNYSTETALQSVKWHKGEQWHWQSVIGCKCCFWHLGWSLSVSNVACHSYADDAQIYVALSLYNLGPT